MNDHDPSDFNASGDSLFEVRLRHAAPAASSIAIEEMMYRAGYETAMKLRVVERTGWSGFAFGACSGALAAGLIWFFSGLTFQNRATSIAPDMIATSHSGPVLEQPADGTGREQQALQRGEVDSPPANPFLRRGDSDPFRDSLSQVAKRQWDQRRLSERTQWVSSRATTDSNMEAEANDSGPQNSLWQIRNSNVPSFGL